MGVRSRRLSIAGGVLLTALWAETGGSSVSRWPALCCLCAALCGPFSWWGLSARSPRAGTGSFVRTCCGDRWPRDAKDGRRSRGEDG